MTSTLIAYPDDDLAGPWQLTSPTPIDSTDYTEQVLLGSDVAGYIAGDSDADGDITEALTLPNIGAFGGGTITRIGVAHYDGGTTTATTHNVSYPSVSILDGDLVEIIGSVQESTAQASGATAPGFTERWFKTPSPASSFKPDMTKLYEFADGGESGTIAVTLPAAARLVADVIVWRGVDQVDPFDGVTAGNVPYASGASNPDPGSVTPATDGAEIVIYCGGNRAAGPGAPGLPANYSLSSDLGGGNRTLAVCQRTLATAAAEDPAAFSWTLDNSGVAVDVLKPATATTIMATVITAVADETATAELTGDPPVLSGVTWSLETSLETPPSTTWKPIVHIWTGEITAYSAGDQIDITVSDHDTNHSWAAMLLVYSAVDDTTPIEVIGSEQDGFSAVGSFANITPTTLGAKVLALTAKTPSGWHYSSSPNHQGEATSPTVPAGMSILEEAVSDSIVLTAWMTAPVLGGEIVWPGAMTWDGVEDWVTVLLALRPSTAAATASDFYAVVDSASEATYLDFAAAAGSMDEVLELNLDSLTPDGVVTSAELTIKHSSPQQNPLRVELVGINADDSIVYGGETELGYYPDAGDAVTTIQTGEWDELADGTPLHEFARLGVRLFSTEAAPLLTTHKIYSVQANIGYQAGGPIVENLTGPNTAGDPITWDYKSDSGLPQTHYQAMVIDGSSQDPDTATVPADPLSTSTGEVIYDSAQVAGLSVRSVSLTDKPLGRGACTVAVRVWARLPNGQTVVSAWVTDNFNITGTEPTTPDQTGNVAPVFDPADGAMVVTVDVPAAVTRAWLLRSNDSGVSYEVAAGSPFTVTASASDVELKDYWAPLASETLRYRVAFDNGAMNETSSPLPVGPTDIDRSSLTTEIYAIVPSNPALNTTLDVMEYRRTKMRRSTTVTQPGNNMVTSSGDLGSQIELTVRLKSAAERVALEALIEHGSWRFVDALGRSFLVTVAGPENPQMQRWRALDEEITNIRDGHEHSFTLIEVGSLPS